MSCTVTVLAISAASRVRDGNSQSFKQKLFVNMVKLFTYYQCYYTFSSQLFFWLVESLQWIFKISARDVKTCRLYSYHVKVTQGHGWSCHVWPQCMISKGNLHVYTLTNKLSVLLTVVTIFFFVECTIKQLLDSVFVISRIIKVSVGVMSLSLRLRLTSLTSTLTLIILDITKTSSNNCL